MPTPEAFRLLCEPAKFDYCSFRVSKDKNSKMNHHFKNEESNTKSPSQTKLIRLAQEIADLTNSLPMEHTSSIFCRVDKSRVDYMKCCIMGAAGTPYAHGAFIYDVFFDNNYPDQPPKVQLITTGGGSIRFNPNLYENGKVCLSLLGTWRGSSTENWDP